jgi:hypothetical protein
MTKIKMKNIFKIIPYTLLFLATFSCEDSKDLVVSANGFELRKDATVNSPSVLTLATATDIFAKFEWDIANNGPATVSSYTLQVFDHNDTSLSNPVEYAGNGLVITPTSRKATLTVAEFNTLLNRLPIFKCSEMDVDVRIKSVLGGNAVNAFSQYSNPINFKITGYSLKMPIMTLVKDGNDASTEPRIAASAPLSNSDYEGYMYLTAGTYKFYQPDACYDFTATTIFGGSAGVLNTGGATTSITVAADGNYLVKVNLATDAYAITKFTSFGVFGKATRTGLGFDNQVPLTYDTATKLWSGQVDLLKGRKFKFKSNVWTGTLVVPAAPNQPYAPGTATTSISILGKSSASNGLQESSVAGQGDITVPGTDDGTRDKYKIELDVSKPRNYTYKLTKVPN